MPFVARCYRCGHIVSARTRAILNICEEEHDLKSHKADLTDSGWTVTVISEAELNRLDQLEKIPKFWATLRLPKH